MYADYLRYAHALRPEQHGLLAGKSITPVVVEPLFEHPAGFPAAS
jgi:hypothetical protein